MEQRKEYSTPELVTYGPVAELTRQGAKPNADVPGGTDGSAYSP